MLVFSVGCLVSQQCHNISPIARSCDSSVLASRTLTLSPSAFLSLPRLKSLQGDASPLWPTGFSVYASPLLFTSATVPRPFAALRQRRNTRYGRVAGPYPTGTLTRQEAPSFAWRTNDSSVLASSTLTLSPSALLPLTRLKSLQDGALTPLAYKILCVRFTCVVHDGSSVPTEASLSATGATLDCHSF
jgi:hypothetical protein